MDFSPLAFLSHKTTRPEKNNGGVEKFERDNWSEEKKRAAELCHRRVELVLTGLLWDKLLIVNKDGRFDSSPDHLDRPLVAGCGISHKPPC